MLDVITRRGDLELTLQIGAEILGSEDPRNRGDHPVSNCFLEAMYNINIVHCLAFPLALHSISIVYIQACNRVIIFSNQIHAQKSES